MKRAYFTTCAECGGPHPNDNRPRTIFSDDVDPAAREEVGHD